MELEVESIESELLGNIAKLDPLVARQAIRLSRPEARRLLSVRYDLVRTVAKYKAGATIIKKEYQIIPIALDFPRKQTARLVQQVETLLGWYGKGHPAFRWLQAHGIKPWLAGGMLSIVNPKYFYDVQSLWRYLHLGYNPQKKYDIYSRPKVLRKLLDSIRIAVTKGTMPFYGKIKQERMEELKQWMLAGRHAESLIPNARKRAVTGNFTAHLDGKCKRELCYWKQVLELDELPPHLPWASCNALSVRLMRKIFFAHLAEVVLVGEQGIRWPLAKPTWIPVPFTGLVKGWDTARIKTRGMNGHQVRRPSAGSRRQPVQDLEPLEWLDG